MKFVALISGGKDSFYNIHHCISEGHELIALANLYPEQTNRDEIDSFMFQTVGHDIIENYSKCLDLPLYRQPITGGSTNQNLEYSITDNDEIEDLHKLLAKVLVHHPQVGGVSCGAILSQYQRTRVENVCDRLGLTSLTYLWQRNQRDLMQEMCASQLDARIVKVAAIGLNETHLNKSITQLFPTLDKLNQMYEVHICGEGGEFETMVMDASFFNKKITIVDKQIIGPTSDDVSYMRLKVEVEDKEPCEFVKLTAPLLLDEKFQEIYSEVQNVQLIVEEAQITNLEKLSLQHDTEVNVIVKETNTKLYISNLTSSKETLAQQTSDIFAQLSEILTSNNLTFNEIQHVTLLLSDMTHFGEINDIYSKNFEGLFLPPSRICIETKLSKKVQLSCIVLKNTVPSGKSGIHIRSRSFWAPQNIGPYSQSIVDTRDHYKLATLSGQIPLIPSTMGLSDSKLNRLNSVLALQHLERVKALVNVGHIGLLVCFIVNESDLSIVTKTWSEYIDGNQLVIVRVTGLPKGANVEWGGISYENIVGMYDDSDDEEDKQPDLMEEVAAKFEENTVISIGKGSIRIATLFSNDIALFAELSKVKGGHIQLITTQDVVAQLHTYKCDFEYLPVLSLYDHKGTPYKYSVVWKVEYNL